MPLSRTKATVESKFPDVRKDDVYSQGHRLA